MRKLVVPIILFLVILSNGFGQSKNSELPISHLTGDFY
ncbi:MAG TPA: subclass B1 metallo-beta-lactamase, partial [Chryseobacterium sp.]